MFDPPRQVLNLPGLVDKQVFIRQSEKTKENTHIKAFKPH
jgi:hypothetical protein